MKICLQYLEILCFGTQRRYSIYVPFHYLYYILHFIGILKAPDSITIVYVHGGPVKVANPLWSDSLVHITMKNMWGVYLEHSLMKGCLKMSCKRRTFNEQIILTINFLIIYSAFGKLILRIKAKNWSVKLLVQSKSVLYYNKIWYHFRDYSKSFNLLRRYNTFPMPNSTSQYIHYIKYNTFYIVYRIYTFNMYTNNDQSFYNTLWLISFIQYIHRMATWTNNASSRLHIYFLLLSKPILRDYRW